MNWLDIVLAIVLCGSMMAGFLRGIARAGVGIAATVIGLILGIWFYGSAGAFFLPYLSSRGLANFAGFLVVFFGILLLGSLVGWLISKLLKWAGLGWLDRLLGAAFGFLRGLLISIALVLALLAFAPKPPPQSVVQSRLAPYVIDAARVLVSIAPRELRDGFESSYERVKSIWRETLEKSAPPAPRREL
ncbi:MAG: CvpA family protein [Acidobacteria bacterium]|nr:CvpA family protein [Acidobacteriota bacterium]